MIDRARVKAFTAHADAQEEALVVKAFGRSFRPAFPDRLASLLAAKVQVEHPPLNGLLVAASGAGEIAAALVDLLRQQNDQGNANPLISALNSNAQFGQRQTGSNDSILAQALARSLANKDNLNQQGQNDILTQALGNALANAVSRNFQQGAGSEGNFSSAN